jgi:HD-like signal output (HDOD) protein/prolyl-tRNA editing enzyme YbaK/EbsC (Cys-tRNA(Pro) deacylase)
LPVPASVKQLLEKQNVDYSVSAADESHESLLHEQRMRIAGAAKSLIMQDGQGRVQVVTPANCMLDIDLANQQMGRTLRPTTRLELRGFFDKHQLASVPALPKLAGMETLVDSRLMEQETVLLDSGAGDLIEVAKADFATMVAGAKVADVCIPLPQLEANFQASGSDEEDILDAVKNFTTLRIKQRLEETLELPPLPETAQRIIKLRVDPNADISDLANIVETDPSLAAQVVSWAASPYYSAPGKIKSIHDAIVRVLGFDMVLNLALGLALGKTMSMPKDGPAGATPYWQQAVYTAATVEGLVTAIPRENRPGFGMAYLSGLLHNFGWLVLAEVFPPHFSTICRYMEANTQVPAHLIEQHVLGVTREQLSSWLMRLWNMPEEVVVALRQQSNAQCDMEYGEYAKLLFVAQRLLQQRGIGQGPQLEIPLEVYHQLHLDPEKAQQTVDNILESSDDLDNIAHQLNG